MLFTDIYEYVLTGSGQFNYTSDTIELNQDKTVPLIKRELKRYSKYSPYEYQFNLEISSRNYTFIDGNEDTNGIPDWISEIIPVRPTTLLPLYFKEYEKYRDGNEYLQEKMIFPWKYRKPLLVVPLSGVFDIHACYNHKVTITDDDNDGESTYEITTITDDDVIFLDLVTAKFMIALGRSRRAFTLNDLPIINDASELVSDGTTLYEQTLEELKENHSKWWLAWE